MTKEYMILHPNEVTKSLVKELSLDISQLTELSTTNYIIISLHRDEIFIYPDCVSKFKKLNKEEISGIIADIESGVITDPSTIERYWSQ